MNREPLRKFARDVAAHALAIIIAELMIALFALLLLSFVLRH